MFVTSAPTSALSALPTSMTGDTATGEAAASATIGTVPENVIIGVSVAGVIILFGLAAALVSMFPNYCTHFIDL